MQVSFGIAFSSKMRSSMFSSVLKLVLSVLRGDSHCVIVGE